MVSCHLHDSIRTLLSYQPKGFGPSGEAQKQCCFLLILIEGCTVGDRVYGLSMMWVHPYQARVYTMEEVVKQLIPLTSTGLDWPYDLVQLKRDAHHVPLPMEGHLSIMVEGRTSSVTCGRISQVEFCQLLSLGSQVIYLVGLMDVKSPC